MAITESQFGTFHTSETTICPMCGELISWRTYRINDRFYGLVDKLKWHQENDKSCQREQKLKQLINE